MTNSLKPVFLRISGNRQKSLELRKFADKLLQQSKHRNETLGNYANPVYRFREGDNKFKVSSLPGYDIIEIDTPIEEEKEVLGLMHVYSGLMEVRFNPGGLEWYLRHFPSFYELYNREQFFEPGPGSSINGALVIPQMPPNRWMYNDYDLEARQEMSWFDQDYIFGHVAGRFSGKLRELVQLQLGAGIDSAFSYNIFASNGLRLEVLSPTETRVWLYEISSARGVQMQYMFDYTETALERALNLRKGGVPVEITETGFFALQTRFDNTRDVYTKAQYDALNPQPPLQEVTFQLMTPTVYNNAVDTYSVLGDYGWSFNPTGTSAVVVGIGFNKPDPGTPAQNYKSQLFTITIDIVNFTASISGGGENLFLFQSANDQIKVPDASGLLTSNYFFQNEVGGIGSQPSNSYTAPMYAYYDKIGALQTIEYKYEAGVTGDFNGNTGSWQSWFAGCASPTNTVGNVEYSGCSTGRSGTGTLGLQHGFVSNLFTTDSFDAWTGWEGNWAGLTGFPNIWVPSFNLVINERDMMVNIQHHYLVLHQGTWSGGTFNVLVIPSFERMGYYHFKQIQENFDGARLGTTSRQFVYELANPTRLRSAAPSLTACNLGLTDCGVRLDAEIRVNSGPATYQIARSQGSFPAPSQALADPNLSCLWAAMGSTHPCWVDPGNLSYPPVPGFEVQNTSNISRSGGIKLPDGSSIIYAEEEIEQDVFDDSSVDSLQGCISAFDIFDGLYVFSQPKVGIHRFKDNISANFPVINDLIKYKVHFTGTPGAIYE